MAFDCDPLFSPLLNLFVAKKQNTGYDQSEYWTPDVQQLVTDFQYNFGSVHVSRYPY